MYKPKPLSFFLARIGKKVFRDDNDCPCKDCRNVAENGLLILDKFHAQCLADVDADFGAEGNELNYRDEK